MPERQPASSKPQKQQQKVEGKKRVFSVLSMTLGAATLLGVPAACITFYPRFSAQVSDPTNSKEAFSSSVTITNTGYLPLSNVIAGVAIKRLVIKGHEIKGDEYSSVMYLTPDLMAPVNLGLDERSTFALNDFFTGGWPSPDSADMAIVVEYQIPIVHFNCKKVFPFAAKKQSNGNVYWYAKPAN